MPEHGRKIGYYPIGATSALTVKPELLAQDKEASKTAGVKVTMSRERHLGAVTGPG